MKLPRNIFEILIWTSAISALILAACIVFLLSRVAFAEWSVRVLWDPSTTNVDGTECTDLAGYDVGLSEPDVVGQPTTSDLIDTEMAVGVSPELTLTPLLRNIADGTTLKVWVRAVDVHLNYSAWSTPSSFTVNRQGFDQTPPTRPTGGGAKNR